MRNALDFWNSDFWTPTYRRPAFNPACDAEENDTHYLFSFDLPGVKKDDVKIEVVDNQLLVSGERKDEKRSEESGPRHIIERFHGAFQRAFTLPIQVDSEKVEASFADGVLKIAVPKAETAKPRLIKIN